jgi:hypothetical protein
MTQTTLGNGVIDSAGSLALRTNGTTTAVTFDTSQNATFVGTITPTQTGGVVGTTTNNSANTGSIGEYVSAQVTGSTTGLTSGTAANATSISLTAGDWDVSGAIFANFGTGTATSLVVASISLTSATNQTATSGYCTYLQLPFTTAGGCGTTVPTLRISISSTTTVYLVASIQFTGGTAGVGGFLRARRAR